nr:glycosyltransferase [uncultured Blautia sp.]
MKIAIINSLSEGSTGNISRQLCKILNESGKPCEFFYGNWSRKIENGICFGFRFENILSGGISKITGIHNIYCYFGTRKLLRRLSKEKVDTIHLHNLHLWVINVPMLFRYIKKHNVKVIWTLHDCWAFTGHCPHFDMIGCEKWKTGCFACPQYKDYPSGCFDHSKLMYKQKRKWFLGVKNMTIVTPSQWLANLVKQSYLKDYPVKVINNGINLDIFKPSKSEFRNKYDLKNKKLILGVAFGWGRKKGLDVFINLATTLDDSFKIVLVGTNEEIDKILPSNILSIHRTQNQKELAEIYTAADLFVNPTREENFPTVNMESLACGTPVLTFKTGGSPEMIDETCGSVVPKNDVDAMCKEIIRICNTNCYSITNCLKKAATFDMNKRFKEYLKLYEE